MNVYKITGTLTYTWFPPEEENEQDIVSLSEYDSVFDGIDKPWRVSQVVTAENRKDALAQLRTIPGALPDAWIDDEELAALKVESAGPAVPFFFKQAILAGKKTELPLLDGRRWAEFPDVNSGAISLDDLPRNGWATMDRQGNIEEYDGEWDGDDGE